MRSLKVLFYFLVVGTLVSYWTLNYQNHFGKDSTRGEMSVSSEICPDGNVMGIEVHGTILTYIPNESNSGDDKSDENEERESRVSSDRIIHYLEQAEGLDRVKAVLLEFDSYGGSLTAGKEIADAFKRVQKPTVAVIRSSGTSSAYLAASGADTIFVSPTSDVGGIGVNWSFLEETGKNNREGLVYERLVSAQYKDIGNSNKPLTNEERQLMMRDIVALHDMFVQDVAVNRGLDEAAIKNLADGSTMLGKRALDVGLADRLGDQRDAITYLEKIIGEKPSLCWH